MAFKVAARTILQLGSELISSDAIAFYELIKNGFDAGSNEIEIEFLIRIPGERWHDCHAALFGGSGNGHSGRLTELQAMKNTLIDSVDLFSPDAANLVETIELASTTMDLRTAFQEANTISIRDLGSGMSLSILADAFLTIGTRFRRVERENVVGSSQGRIILGDKGVGRLSVMRLGSQLHVKTTQMGDRNWHELAIDWEIFSHDSNLLLSEIPIEPTEGSTKEDFSVSGTELRISGLVHSWTRGQIEEIVRSEFSRFMDPFAARQPKSIRVLFNASRIPVPRFDRILFDNAHAMLTATMTPDDTIPELNTPTVTGSIDYRAADQKVDFRLNPLHLASISQTTVSVVREIGPFQLELYWWNRRALRAVEGIGDRRLVRALLDRWSGGVAVYRDGFRVNPYGGTDDDWLGLDKDAFRAPGYKLNRGQIVAKLTISRYDNPHLVDQTNREGLQHNTHFLALRAIVKHILENQLRAFLDQSDRQAQLSRIGSVEQLETRTRQSGRRVRDSVRQLRILAPKEVNEIGILDQVDELLKEIDRTFSNTRARVRAYEAERDRLVTLAGTGLMVEVVAHELNRATTNALALVVKAADDPNLAPAQATLEILGSQLRTLRTRLSVLDEISVSGRQVKVSFDFVDWVAGILESHKPQFERHQVQIALHTVPENSGQMRVRMVRGMVVQILENLLSNSIYWLALQKSEEPQFKPQIEVIIDVAERTMTLVDNGPGIERSRANDVFRPFVTSKPPGEGSGLGLYIAREVADYHGAALRLSPEPAIHADKFNAFTLSLANVEE